jgi:hypothetical protein
MTKTFEQHAAEAQMTEADRIAHAATWDAAIEAAAKACDEAWRYGDFDACERCANAVRALATK